MTRITKDMKPMSGTTPPKALGVDGDVARALGTTFLAGQGLYALVDGQYGSTGKGLVGAVLAEVFGDKVDYVTSNAGPNSGHTSYFRDEKIVLKQLPTFAVYARKMGHRVPVFMNGGAILDTERLEAEITEHNMGGLVHAHSHAAIVDSVAKDTDKDTVERIGSTGTGTGPALAAKILRRPSAVLSHLRTPIPHSMMHPLFMDHLEKKLGFMEISQGYSLGIDAGFYPYTTSRNCTVGAALADAGIHPVHYRDAIMVVRTFPIRVAGNSGPCYPDQHEVTWEELGQEPEITTVTKKVRRVFTWSKNQYMDALRANWPSVVFVNFCNYLQDLGQSPDEFVEENVVDVYRKTLGRLPACVLMGFGPKVSDVRLWKG